MSCGQVPQQLSERSPASQDSAQNQPNFVDVGRRLVDLEQVLAKLDQAWTNSVDVRLIGVKLAPNLGEHLAQLGQHVAQIDKGWCTLCNSLPTSADVGQIGPNYGQHRSNLGRISARRAVVPHFFDILWTTSELAKIARSNLMRGVASNFAVTLV